MFEENLNLVGYFAIVSCAVPRFPNYNYAFVFRE
jgi:hypothetical protein